MVLTDCPFPAVIFVDGACSRNGMPGARAGWGASVFINGQECDAVSVPLEADEVQTNNRAELYAILGGLDAIKRHKQSFCDAGFNVVRIYSDSLYAISTVQDWGPRWESELWTNGGKPIANLDLVKNAVMSARDTQGIFPFILEYIEGHQTGLSWRARGNARADKLATAAVRGALEHETPLSTCTAAPSVASPAPCSVPCSVPFSTLRSMPPSAPPFVAVDISSQKAVVERAKARVSKLMQAIYVAQKELAAEELALDALEVAAVFVDEDSVAGPYPASGPGPAPGSEAGARGVEGTLAGTKRTCEPSDHEEYK